MVVDRMAALIAASGATTALVVRLDQALAPWRKALGAGAPMARSLLTPGGAPLELTLRSGATGGAGQVAFTVEPALADAPLPHKWQRLCALAPEAADRFPPLAKTLRQADGQRFGCWLGLRESGAKVYQEVAPAARPATLAAMADDWPHLASSIGLVPQLVGFSSGSREYYAHWPRADAAALHRLLSALGHGATYPLVVDMLCWLSGSSADDGWASLRSGVSLTRSEDGGTVVSLYWHGRSLFGSPDLSPSTLSYRRLHDVAGHMGGLDALAPLCAAAEAHGLPLYCGMVGVMLRPGQPPLLTLGIAPVLGHEMQRFPQAHRHPRAKGLTS